MKPHSLSKKDKKAERRAQNVKWKQSILKLSSVNADLEENLSTFLADPNPRHTLYYEKQLALCWDATEDAHEQWLTLRKTLAKPMPVTWRPSHACPLWLIRHMASLMQSSAYRHGHGRFIEVHGEVLDRDVVKPVSWLHKAAVPVVYQAAMDSTELSKNSSLSHLHSYLQREVQLNHVVRQELASMVPAALLDVEPFHCVLDVCAAPGSKTEQLLQIMCVKARQVAKGGIIVSPPSGAVVANDADLKRIKIFKTRYNRSLSPQLLVVNRRAEDLHELIVQYKRQQVQKLYHAVNSDEQGNPTFAKCSKWDALEEVGMGAFDRIVADVPCSGDGTIRKFPHIWRLFRPRVALELHNIQLQIAKSSVLMLKPGGRIVYSTCSLNPLENESVVSALLRYFNRHSGAGAGAGAGAGVDIFQKQYGVKPSRNYSLRLVDTRKAGLLPNLKSRPGLDFWHTSTDVFVPKDIESSEEEHQRSLDMLPPVLPSMLPPTEEEKQWMHLEYCHRILPHDMDCGGFFAAVLELVEVPASGYVTESKIEKASKNPCNANEYGSADHGIDDSKIKLVDVTAVKSTDVMSTLGYNPLVAQNMECNTTSSTANGKGKGKDKDKNKGNHKVKKRTLDLSEIPTEHLRCQMLSSSRQRQVIQCLGLNPLILKEGHVKVLQCKSSPTAVTASRKNSDSIKRKNSSEPPPSAGGALFGSRSNGWAKHTDGVVEDEKVTSRIWHALVSKSVRDILSSWASSGDDGASDRTCDGGSLVVQAGLDLCSEDMRWLPSGSNATAYLLSGDPFRSSMQDNIVQVPPVDFLLLSRLGVAQKNDSNERDSLLSEALLTVLESMNPVNDHDNTWTEEDEEDVFPLSAITSAKLSHWNQKRLETYDAKKPSPQYLFLVLDTTAATAAAVKCSDECPSFKGSMNKNEGDTSVDGSRNHRPRMSKKQRKQMKAGRAFESTSQKNSSEIQMTATKSDTGDIPNISEYSGGETVLIVACEEYSSENGSASQYPRFSWVSPVDTCQSYAFSLEAVEV